MRTVAAPDSGRIPLLFQAVTVLLAGAPRDAPQGLPQWRLLPCNLCSPVPFTVLKGTPEETSVYLNPFYVAKNNSSPRAA